MTHQEIRQKFLDYFVAHGHTVVPSSPLVPSGDESVLLTTAGMQQFKPYLMGEADALADFGNTRLTSVQKCFRTSDIEDVGDEHHHTFFEMLGNFSIGDYFKEQAIPLAWNFLTQELKLDPQRMFVTVLGGGPSTSSGQIPRDEESRRIWEREAPGIEIREYGKEENFWGPPGETGPCGPCSEIIYTLPSGLETELWNLVFMEYYKDEQGKYRKLKQKNIDTGMGLERLALVLQEKETVFETDLFAPIVAEIDKIAKVDGKGDPRSLRIIADHIRGAIFLIADGVQPLNVGRGYVLRRILRRAVLHGRLLDISGYFLLEPAKKVIGLYSDVYPEVSEREKEITEIIEAEEQKFGETLNRGMKQLEKMGKKIDAFALYDTYGFPLELTKELAQARDLTVDEREFEKKLEEQRERARLALSARGESAFGGKEKVADEEIAPQHTAAHLLNAALKTVLGLQVRQAGQHLEAGKFRHDFTFGRKLTDEELKKVEALVNEKIKEDLPVIKVETTYEKAKEAGAEAVFTEKYKELEKVMLYHISDDPKSAFSKELCAGPHVKKTSEIGRFEIIKEEAAGAGVRRIYGRAVNPRAAG